MQNIEIDTTAGKRNAPIFTGFKPPRNDKRPITATTADTIKITKQVFLRMFIPLLFQL